MVGEARTEMTTFAWLLAAWTAIIPAAVVAAFTFAGYRNRARSAHSFQTETAGRRSVVRSACEVRRRAATGVPTAADSRRSLH
jgi:hypothetical protein